MPPVMSIVFPVIRILNSSLAKDKCYLDSNVPDGDIVVNGNINVSSTLAAFWWDTTRMSTKAEKRSYHHGNLREAVLQQAGIVLERDGIGNVSLREISRVLEVSHTAPRRHFPTKRHLLDALAVYGYAQLGAALTRALRNRDPAFEVRLQRATGVLVQFALRHPALLGHMFAAKHQPDATPELIEASDLALSPGIKLFVEGQTTGDVVEGDPELLALVPFAAVQGLIVVSSNGSFRGTSLEKLVEQATDCILVGLRPRP